MRKYKLGDIATVEISGVDKKIKDGEEDIRLCNFVDVYYNWAITMARHDSLMLATARPNEISKFQLKKGQVALTKDSETRDDIGISTYIADDFNDVILGYHCALITPNKDIADRFEELISPIFNQIIKLHEEILNLTKQRDKLLPLLMNGQVLVNSDLSAY